MLRWIASSHSNFNVSFLLCNLSTYINQRSLDVKSMFGFNLRVYSILAFLIFCDNQHLERLFSRCPMSVASSSFFSLLTPACMTLSIGRGFLCISNPEHFGPLPQLYITWGEPNGSSHGVFINGAWDSILGYPRNHVLVSVTKIVFGKKRNTCDACDLWSMRSHDLFHYLSLHQSSVFELVLPIHRWWLSASEDKSAIILLCSCFHLCMLLINSCVCAGGLESLACHY